MSIKPIDPPFNPSMHIGLSNGKLADVLLNIPLVYPNGDDAFLRIAAERLRENDPGRVSLEVQKLTEDLKKLNTWLPIDEFMKDPVEGLCWLEYDGEIINSYCFTYSLSLERTVTFLMPHLSKHPIYNTRITKVQPITKPKAPG